MSRLLISIFALGRYASSTVFLAVSQIAAIVTLDGAVVSPGRLHSNPTTYDQEGVVRTGKAVDVQGTHHAPNICQAKIPPLVASCADSLMLGRKGLKNDVFVPLVGYWLAHILQTLALVVHGLKKMIGILAGLHLGIVQIFVVRPPSLLCLIIVLLFQGIPRRLPVTDPILPGLAMCFFTTLWAERSVVKIKMPKRFSFTRVHVATAGEFCAVVGFDSP